MRIGFYNPYLDALGGGERYTLTLASHWSSHHSVHVFWDDDQIKNEVQRRLNIDLSRLKITQNIFRGKNLSKKALLSHKYDLIFFLSDGSLPFSLAKNNILHFQNPFPHVRGRSLLNILKLKRFQAVVCNSFFTKGYIDQEYGVNSKVIYPPVSLGEFKPRPKKNIILSVGRFSKYYINKRQKEMVKIFRNVVRVHKNWELYLVGGLLNEDRPYFEEVKTEARGLPVKLLPNEPFSRLKELYGQAAIYWHAAGYGVDPVRDPAGLEHFGIAVVEAMAAGCVPLVFNGGGLPEIVDHNVSGFLWNDADDLIEYTTRVITARGLRVNLARAAQERSQDFDESKFLLAFDKLLEKVYSSYSSLPLS